MKRRLEALARIGKLQKQLHELAAWRLAQIGRRRDGLVEDERAMWRGDGRGPFAPTVRRPKRRCGASAGSKRRSPPPRPPTPPSRARPFKEGARAKLAERAHDGLEAKYRDQKQRKALAELIERSLGKPPSSSA